ncbi:hypothetical protein IMG5_054010, partial [Ichthyophthirius multifiliis]
TNMFFSGFPFFEEGSQGGHQRQQKETDTQKLYDILGVPKDATTAQIKKSFMQHAKTHHPDRGGNSEKFKEYQQAYEILSDPNKRELYDQYGLEGVENGGGGGHEDIFDILTGGGNRGVKNKRGMQKMRGVKAELEVTLEESYLGKTAKMPFQRQRNCETCDGKGGSEVKQCTTCKGRGVQVKTIQMGPMIQQFQQECGTCKGEGKIINEKDKCKSCKGNKVYAQKSTLDIPIDKGAYDGQEIIMHGEADEAPGYMAGDLHVIVKTKPHKVYQREGADLIMKKKISLLEALTGFCFKIQTLDNTEVQIATNPGEIIFDGAKKIVKGYGMPFYGDSMSHGNLIVVFEVEFPKTGSLSEQQLKKLAEILPGPKPKQVDISKDDILMLEEFDPHTTNPNEEGGKRGEEDDEEDEKSGQTRAQCAQQ